MKSLDLYLRDGQASYPMLFEAAKRLYKRTPDKIDEFKDFLKYLVEEGYLVEHLADLLTKMLTQMQTNAEFELANKAEALREGDDET